MPQRKKSFSDFKVFKVSGADLLREKPLFCDKGRKLVISNRETCHLYSTSTGEHIKQIFSCDSPIISLQVDSLDGNQVYAFTEKGEVIKYYLETENEERGTILNLNAKILEKRKTPLFNTDVNVSNWKNLTTDVNWCEELKKEVKFVHIVIYKELIYASWYLKDEFFAHFSLFQLSGEQSKLKVGYQNVALQKVPQNFLVNNNILLCMSTEYVCVASLPSMYMRLHMIAKSQQITCIGLAKDEECFATGDLDGRIVVWRSIFKKSPLKEIFHWHALPVRTLTFTDFATNLFSGGEENVLVKWSLETRQKTFLPRLSSSITNVTFAEETDLLAVSTADSRILIVNVNMTCLATIQHFSRWAAMGFSFEGKVLSYDYRTNAIVLNGKTGHIQFLSASDNGRFLYTFDVTNRNFITSHRNSLVENVEVHFARFTSDGRWLITAEAGGGEAGIKFWMYDDSLREFKLNTAVDSPHLCKAIYCLEVSSDEQVITTGADDKFRLWNVMESNHLQELRLYWGQTCAIDYRGLPVSVADFARDGSIAGVGFGPSLTIWDTESNVLKCSLTPPLRRNILNAIKFGNLEVSHLVVTGTESEITCWNLVTLSMQWMVPLQLATLVNDPNSVNMCAFSKKGGLFVFNPSSAFPEIRLENVCNSRVTAALFLAKPGAPYIYFLTSDQEVYCFGEEQESASEAVVSQKVTPFSSQIAEVVKKDIKETSGLDHLIISSKVSPMMLLDGPAHALPPVSLLLQDVLRSLLLSTTLSEKQVSHEEISTIKPPKKQKIPTINEPKLNEVVEKLFDN